MDPVTALVYDSITGIYLRQQSAQETAKTRRRKKATEARDQRLRHSTRTCLGIRARAPASVDSEALGGVQNGPISFALQSMEKGTTAGETAEDNRELDDNVHCMVDNEGKKGE